MNRRDLRDKVFKLLFRIEFNSTEEMEEQQRLFFLDEENLSNEQTTLYVNEKYLKIVDKLPEIDADINQIAMGWSTERMSKVDLTIIRLAIFEIKYDDEVPTGVAINEAVELAKRYGQDESSVFVNGILAKFA
ncbi:MAG: transcription antitermination factor NusB [Clostridiales bacterium]|nr:transcription antitermination factor NusB [Clostridiales bacterium]